MVSFKEAIKKIHDTELYFLNTKISTYCDNKYNVFKDKTIIDSFYSEVADKIFKNIWLKNKYYDIISQNIANKLLECGSSLSEVIAKNMVKKILTQFLKKEACEDNLIKLLNSCYNQGYEKNIISLLRQQQRDYYIKMINNRPEESNYFAFFLTKVYL